MDIGCSSHICANVQGLKKSRDLHRDEIDLQVWIGAKVATLAVRSYCLSLPSRLLLNLNNCYYVPSMNRNLISISMLDSKGSIIVIKNGSFSIYKDEIYYGVGHYINGLYIPDLEK